MNNKSKEKTIFFIVPEQNQMIFQNREEGGILFLLCFTPNKLSQSSLGASNMRVVQYFKRCMN